MTNEALTVLANLYGEPRLYLEGCQRDIQVYLIKLKQLPQVTAFLHTVLTELQQQHPDRDTVTLDSGQILNLIAKLPDEVNRLIPLLTSLTAAEVEELDVADGLAVVQRIVEINRAFFMARVKPQLDQLLTLIQTGPPPSS